MLYKGGIIVCCNQVQPSSVGLPTFSTIELQLRCHVVHIVHMYMYIREHCVHTCMYMYVCISVT